uniref:Uncharacterized protein n=1 Tax=Alexandrium andersonii TaxID=327968 RepID=A0A7S2IZS9_9DINO
MARVSVDPRIRTRSRSRSPCRGALNDILNDAYSCLVKRITKNAAQQREAGKFVLHELDTLLLDHEAIIDAHEDALEALTKMRQSVTREVRDSMNDNPAMYYALRGVTCMDVSSESIDHHVGFDFEKRMSVAEAAIDEFFGDPCEALMSMSRRDVAALGWVFWRLFVVGRFRSDSADLFKALAMLFRALTE